MRELCKTSGYPQYQLQNEIADLFQLFNYFVCAHKRHSERNKKNVPMKMLYIICKIDAKGPLLSYFNEETSLFFLSFSDLSRRNSFNTKVLIKMQLALRVIVSVSARKGQTSDCAWELPRASP